MGVKEANMPTREISSFSPVAPMPLEHVAYLYDGSAEGLLCAVFEAYARHEEPEDIVGETDFQPRLGQSWSFIETDFKKAQRVRAGIVREAGEQAFGAVMRAIAADDPGKGTVVYRFIQYAMEGRTHRGRTGIILNELGNPVVSNLVELCKRTASEAENMRQFIRFSHLENGVWFARCNPNASVVPFVMPHFVARFNIQPFIIYDENHHMAGVYDGDDWHLVRDKIVGEFVRADGDAYMEALWQRFYDAVAIEARYNPELRRNFMPVRLWKHLPEMMPREFGLARAGTLRV